MVSGALFPGAESVYRRDGALKVARRADRARCAAAGGRLHSPNV